jgi:hypothetical protein
MLTGLSGMTRGMDFAHLSRRRPATFKGRHKCPGADTVCTSAATPRGVEKIDVGKQIGTSKILCSLDPSLHTIIVRRMFCHKWGALLEVTVAERPVTLAAASPLQSSIS